jgi:hypothetical protein
MNSKAPKDAKWQGYTAAATDDQARAAFAKKFGRNPQELHRSPGCVLAGPLTEEEAK